MALLHSDGFDIFSNINEVLASGWGRLATANGFSTSGGRFGGGCLQGTLVNGNNGWIRPVLTAIGSPLYVAFAYFHDGTANTNDILFSALSPDNALIGSITLTPTGQMITANASGTVINTTVGNPITSGSWHWVEIKIIAGSTGSNGEITARVDGSTVINQTGIDTQPGTTSQPIAYFRLSGPRLTGAGSVVKIDDVFVMNDSGATFNGFMDDRRILSLIPSGDAATVDWTASSGTDVSCVDDALGAANDDTDYISSSTVGQESRFTLGNLSVTPASIDAVVPRMRAKKDDAGGRTIRALINSSGNEATGATQGLLTDYVWMRSSAFEVNPNGSVAWTDSAVNALELGVEVVA